MEQLILALVGIVYLILAAAFIANDYMLLLGMLLGSIPWSLPLTYGCIMNWVTNR